MVNDKRLNNMHKFLYLVKEYPDKSIDGILGGANPNDEPGVLPTWPNIDKNVAVWDAIEAGFIKDPAGNAHSDPFDVIELPTNWEFGQEVQDLMDALVFACEMTAKKEMDFSEGYLAGWLAGYQATDIFVGLKWLLETGKLVSYVLEDAGSDDNAPSSYLFYTLPQNKAHLWGRKQFKKDPLGEK